MTHDPSRTADSSPPLIVAEPVSRHVLLLASPDTSDTEELTRCLNEIGAPASTISTLEEGREILSEARLDVCALLIQTGFDGEISKRKLKGLLTDAAPAGLGFISVGEPPSEPDRKKIRKAGVRLALWNPICEATLRFQIHRAINGDWHGLGHRDHPRVPTAFHCTVTVGARKKETLIYSLAESGAFLATQRASMDGARLSLELCLPDGSISTPASVVYANVPGNLQRPGLPLGMGVRFEPLSRDDSKRLQAYVAASMERLRV